MKQCGLALLILAAAAPSAFPQSVVAPCLISTVARGGSQQFEDAMARFEDAKRRSAWPEAERHIRQAVAMSANEYAVGSLVWTLLRTQKSEEALDVALRMHRHFGPTAYSLVSVIDAGIAEGAWSEVRPYVEYAKRNRVPASMDWQAQNLSDLVRRYDEITRPTVFHLKWTIPVSTLGDGQAKVFKFPILKTSEQTFVYKISGAKSHELVHSSPATTAVRITGAGKEVTVDGVATFTQLPLGARVGRSLAMKPLKAGPVEDTGKFYYHREVFDPQHAAIADLAKSVRRRSAYDTIQAILDWRARNMPYGQLPGGPEDTLARIMKHKTGVCHHISHIATCLARANGIPSYVIGTLRLPDEATFSGHVGAHGIIAVRLDGTDWISLEPQSPDALQTFSGRRDLRFSFQGRNEKRVDENLQGMPVSGRRLP